MTPAKYDLGIISPNEGFIISQLARWGLSGRTPYNGYKPWINELRPSLVKIGKLLVGLIPLDDSEDSQICIEIRQRLKENESKPRTNRR